MLKPISMTLFGVFFVVHAGLAEAGSLEKSLMKLSPEERAHQACVVKGLETLRRDKRFSRADRLMPDTFKRASFKNNLVSAKGAAVRADKHWFEVSFTCTVSDDQLKAVAFQYEVGKEIPPDTWENVGLWQ